MIIIGEVSGILVAEAEVIPIPEVVTVEEEEAEVALVVEIPAEVEPLAEEDKN